MKTVLLVVSTGTHVRDTLRTSTFTILRDAGVRCVICAAAYNDARFAEEFQGLTTVIEPLLPYRLTGVERKLKVLRDASFMYQKRVRTMQIMLAPRRFGDWPRYLIIVGVGHWLARLPLFQKVLDALDRFWIRSDMYNPLFNCYQPDLVVTPSPGFNDSDRPLLQTAHARGVPIVCLVSSWDNLTSKGTLVVPPDELIVWNDIMREEAIQYHDFPSERIRVVGVPQFDLYADPRILMSREEFACKLGFNPAEQLITYATSAQSVFGHSTDVAELLLEAIRTNRWGRPCCLLLRLHPRDDPRLYQRFQGRPNVIVDLPGRSSEYMDWDPDEADVIRLANTMFHSAVLVNVASTITVDACVFDTPVVNVAFDGRRNLPYLLSTQRYYDYLHYRHIVESGGVTVAKSAAELLHGIARYLSDRSLHHEGRRRIVKRIAYRLDGHAGERAGARLLQLLGVGASSSAAVL